MNASNSSSAGTQHDSPFYNLPLLAYERIFSHLDCSSIRECRLVCSEWYIIILKLYSSPNSFCIQTAKYAWNTTKCLEENIKKSLEMKVYEDNICPVENLKLENVSIGDCEKLIEKSADFRETIDNITALNLTNAYFGDCPTLLKFLGRFKKLRKLVLIHGTFSSLIEMSFFHLRSNNVARATDVFGVSELPRTLRSLYIEIRQDNSSAPLLLEILNAKIKELIEFRLKVIPCSDGLFRSALTVTTFNQVISPLQRSTFFLCWFLASSLKKYDKSLKSLRIHWKMDGINFTLFQHVEGHNFNIRVATTVEPFRSFWESFTPLLLEENQLRLTELSLEVGNVPTFCTQFNEVILPFVAIQIHRELRQITLSHFQSPLVFPGQMYPQLFPDLQGVEFQNFVKVMKMNLSMELTMVGNEEYLPGIQTFLADKYSLLYLRELKISIKTVTDVMAPITNFAQLLPDYDINGILQEEIVDDSESEEDEDQENEGQENEGQENEGQENEGQENEGQENEAQENEAQENEAQENEGQEDEDHEDEDQGDDTDSDEEDIENNELDDNRTSPSFCSLETLIIHLEFKHLKNANICRICYQCPALKVLEIVDGPFYAYRNKKLDKGKISSVIIQDVDIRFIFSHLKNLRSLTIWANMESITDFAITGYSQSQQISPDEVNIVNNMRLKENASEVLQGEMKIKDNHPNLNSTIQTLLEFPVADLKTLQNLSLRGVGIGITDTIVSTFVSDDNKRLVAGLERLEIIGQHKISQFGSQKLKRAIKEVSL